MFSLALRGFALGFAIAASPGPIFFLCVRRTLLRGRLYGLLSGFGVATVDALYAAIATSGIAFVATAVSIGERPIALIGAGVLVALGIRILFEPTSTEPRAAATGQSLLWAYLSTVGLTITNPATIISFAALAATLGLGTAGNWARPAAVVGGVLIGSATWWFVLVMAAGALGSRLTPRLTAGISILSGLAIIAIGLVAAYTAFT